MQLSVIGYRLLAAISSFIMIGCATVEYAPTPKSAKPLNMPGIYHRVEKGQTLWRISKLYGASLDEIISLNNINDVAQIDPGQLIFIPRKEKRAVFYPAVDSGSIEDFIWPVRGEITSGFGQKNKNITSKGITLRPYSNSNVVVACASGEVVFANENLKGYGKTVVIAHKEGIMTVYTYLSQILVKPGDYLRQGAAIARCENGLFHFELRKGHIPQNPRYYLPG